ncbi:MAG: 16S rRNA (cytosine(1402)-N(4))-methyltransferase RsmH [Candidatus Riflebacteria bacterium]|nr:16S rRNA (cytosine(1402)-N(4))-methyltransferase RsmH [Candidatus Riflebacteria bacterium]
MTPAAAVPPAHEPVLLDEVVDLASRGPHRVVLDCTVGLGGHAQALLERLPDIETYVGIDRDPEALEQARARLSRFGDRLRTRQTTFDRSIDALDELGIGAVQFVLVDLGVSSFQLETGRRGFSFRLQGPLDMRMDPRDPDTAADLIRRLGPDDLARLLRDRGEVECAERLARALHDQRLTLRTTTDLARLVAEATPARVKARLKIHPATKVFMALRSAVNQEPEILERALPRLIDRLAPGGRIVVISFHSLEDRIAKRIFRGAATGCVCPPVFPVCNCGKRPTLGLVDRRPIKPSDPEVAGNPRSRSARMRAAIRL